MSKDTTTCFIAQFIYGNIYPEAHICALSECVKRAGQQRPTLYSGRWGDADVARARARACDIFLESKAEVMVMIDRDIVWDWKGETIQELADNAFLTTSIVAAAQPKKQAKGGIASRLENDVDLTDASVFRKLHKAMYANTGMIAVPRVIVEKVAEFSGRNGNGFSNSWIQFIDDDGVYLSEDWAFCERAKKCGFGCYVKFFKDVHHIGDFKYSIFDAGRCTAEQRKELGAE